MDQKDIDAFEAAIVSAIEEAQKGGYRIIHRSFGNPNKGTMCPITALSMKTETVFIGENDTNIVGIKGFGALESEHCWAFIEGFDTIPSVSAPSIKKSWNDTHCLFVKMGERLRERFKPVLT